MASNTIDIKKLIDGLPFNRAQLGIMFLCSLVALLDGFDAQAISFVASAMARDLHVNVNTFGPIFGAGTLGMALGALGLPMLCDRWGRRRLIIASVVMFGIFSLATVWVESFTMLAWFWAFFDASLFAGEAHQVSRVEFTGGVWPPQGIEVLDPFHLPLYNTIILLLSGTTVTWAHHALLHNDRDGLVNGLALTVGLGTLFSMVQAFEYFHAPFSFRDSIYGATFFMATGFHGFHVVIGTIFLLVCLIRAMRGDFTPRQHFGFEAAAWYWHFVDVVWLFLFASIYVWASMGATIVTE